MLMDSSEVLVSRNSGRTKLPSEAGSTVAQDDEVPGKMSLRCDRSGANAGSSSLRGFDAGVTDWVGMLSPPSTMFLFDCLLDLTLYTHSSPARWQRTHWVNEALSPTHRSFCWWHLSHDFRNVRPSACFTVEGPAHSRSYWCRAAVSIFLSRWLLKRLKRHNRHH